MIATRSTSVVSSVLLAGGERLLFARFGHGDCRVALRSDKVSCSRLARGESNLDAILLT